MKHRLSGKLKNTIELTSLLDIIFIVLMIVICNQQINMTQKEEAAQIVMEQAEDARAEAEAEKELLKQHNDTYAEINDQMEIITVYVDYKPSDIKNREIRMVANDTELPMVTLSPSNARDAYGRFEAALEKQISEAEKADKPVIISIDTTQILYRDEKAVEEIVGRLFDSHDNLYYKKSGN